MKNAAERITLVFKYETGTEKTSMFRQSVKSYTDSCFLAPKINIILPVQRATFFARHGKKHQIVFQENVVTKNYLESIEGNSC